MNHHHYLEQTVALAVENIQKDGGPFAAMVVDADGNIVGIGQNSVTKTNDPTAHAEVLAIRDACQKLEHFQLEGCTLYTSCEPCPMCLGAIYWARPDAVYYAATQQDAAAGGFDDAFIYEEIDKPYNQRKIPFHGLRVETTTKPFTTWNQTIHKTDY